MPGQPIHPLDIHQWAARYFPQALINVLAKLPRDKDAYTGTYLQLALMEGDYEAASLVVQGRCHYQQELLQAVEAALVDEITQAVQGA